MKLTFVFILSILTVRIVDIYQITKENTGLSRREWPPSETLRPHQKACYFPFVGSDGPATAFT